MKRPIAQAVAIVIASMAIAVIANGFAGRTRRLALPGWWPNALSVPQRAPETATAPAPAATSTTTTTAQSPAPGNPPIVIPTTTITETAPATPGQPANPTTQQPPQQPSNPAISRPTQQPSNPATQQLSQFKPHPDKPSLDISGDDAAALHRAGALFLDARRTSVYEEGHIAGARSFSVWEIDVDDKVSALYDERSDPSEQAKPIVIYCSGGACEDSHMLAQKLWAVQFNNVYVYKDGFPDWQKRGLPVRTGANP